MRIPLKRSLEMFQIAGINHDLLHDSLRQMGHKYLRKSFRDKWTIDNPTANYCYVVSEMLYWYKSPDGTLPYSVKVPGDDGLHRFLKFPRHDEYYEIVDLTAEQFPNWEEVDYASATRRMFLQTGCKGPSKRAKILAELMGFEVDKWKKPKDTLK